MGKESVRFYTTSKEPSETAMQITELLRKYGARSFQLEWTEGELMGLTFELPAPGHRLNAVPVRMSPNPALLAARLETHHNIDDEKQVKRVAWRQTKDVLEAILVAAESGLFEALELLLGMVEVEEPDGGKTTLFRGFLENAERRPGGPVALIPSSTSESHG